MDNSEKGGVIADKDLQEGWEWIERVRKANQVQTHLNSQKNSKSKVGTTTMYWEIECDVGDQHPTPDRCGHTLISTLDGNIILFGGENTETSTTSSSATNAFLGRLWSFDRS